MRRLTTALLLLVAACSGTPQSDLGSVATADTTEPATVARRTDAPTTTEPEGGFPVGPIRPLFGADGNRVAPLRGPFDPTPDVIRLRERRVVRVDLPTDDALAIGYDDGELRILSGRHDAMKVRAAPALTGIVYTAGANGVDVLAALADHSGAGRPAVLSNGQIVYITTSGDVVVWDGTEIRRAAVDALVDGDVLVDEEDRVLLLTGPTDRYGHGILGDAIEPTGFMILAPPDLSPVGKGTVAAPAVIEGRRALWADFNGDGRREVQVTVSDAEVGARLVVMDENGSVVAEGAPIGRGSRWRHQIAFGAFAAQPVGVEVVTPHIGGIVTFSNYAAELTGIAHTRSFTSHGIGSRELDMAVAIDIDGDGRLELVLPTQDRTTLVSIGIEGGEAVVEWSSELPSRVSSNVAAGTRAGVPTIAVGTSDGSVLLWQAAG